MRYIHTFEVDYKNSILLAYENNHKSGRLDFELQNGNILKVIDFKSGCNDPNYYQSLFMLDLQNISPIVNLSYMMVQINGKMMLLKILKIIQWHISTN